MTEEQQEEMAEVVAAKLRQTGAATARVRPHERRYAETVSLWEVKGVMMEIQLALMAATQGELWRAGGLVMDSQACDRSEQME